MQADTTALDGIYQEYDIQRELPPVAAQPTSPQRGIRFAPILGWVALGLAAVGAATLALWLAGVNLDAVAANRRKRRDQALGDDAVDGAETGVSANWLREADDLAGQGRFSEAIHALLLGVLATIRAAARERSKATTAREIARNHEGPYVTSLRALVQTSELVHFGGRSGTAEQYHRCRTDALEFDGSTIRASS